MRYRPGHAWKFSDLQDDFEQDDWPIVLVIVLFKIVL